MKLVIFGAGASYDSIHKYYEKELLPIHGTDLGLRGLKIQSCANLVLNYLNKR